MEDQIYQFKISLKEISPMIWRRILIQSDKTLKDLHYVIQIVMGWTNYHLNEFIVHRQIHTIPNMIGNTSGGGYTGSHIKLNELKLKLGKKFIYKYDFTARWEFEIRFENIMSIESKKTYPTCISGSGASPEEECGGPDSFNVLKDMWAYKSWEVMTDFVSAILDKGNARKRIGDVCDIDALREAKYWRKIDKYDRTEANKYLKLYANNDDRWKEAFYEVICL